MVLGGENIGSASFSKDCNVYSILRCKFNLNNLKSQRSVPEKNGEKKVV